MNEPTKKKRGPLLYISAIIFLLLALLLLVFSQNNFTKLRQKIADAKEVVPVIETNEISSPFQEVKLLEESYNASRTTYIIQYPQTDDETFNETILHFVDIEKQNFLALAEKSEVTTKEVINTYTTSVNVSKYNDKFYSFTFNTKTELGSEAATNYVTTFILDSESGQCITFEQLLKGNLRYLETFKSFASEQLLTNGMAIDKEKLQETLTTDWDHYEAFAIENDELVVYFQPGTLANKELGIVSVKSSMGYLNSILADDFKSNSKEDQKTLPLVKDNHKRVALTFDDGPHPKVTEQILNILDEYNAKATFFTLGKNVKKYPEITKDIYARGHEIGNHTYTHPLLTKLSLVEVEDEYTQTENIIFETIGEYPTIFRPPFGATNEEIKSIISVQSVNWSIDTLDWKHRNANKTLQIVKSQMHNNAVILMHDIHQPTADSLRSVLEYLQSEGYEFLTVSEVLPYIEYNM